MIVAKKNERIHAFKEVKRLCKGLEFYAGILKGLLAEGRKKNESIAFRGNWDGGLFN